MKNLNVILAGLFIMVSTVTVAQTKSGFEYFKGKWNVVATGPTGDINMVISFEKDKDKVISSIRDSEGKEIYKVTSTAVNGSQATIMFVGSVGDVEMKLEKKDDDHITGSIMGGMATAIGERIK